MNPEAILRKSVPISKDSSIKKLAGSSSSTTYLVNGKIFKVGPLLEGKKELAMYKKFRRVNNVFPSVKEISVRGGWMVWQVEVLGDKNLEDVILNYKKNKKHLPALFDSVLGKIRLVFNATKGNFEQKENFFDELVKALKTNLRKAGIEENGLSLLRHQKNRFLKDLEVSITHNDLTVGNIIVNKKMSELFFIDPRVAVPYLENSSGWGNVAIDLIGFYVSFLRKEAELKKFGLKTSPAFLFLKKEIEKEIKRYETEKVFNPIFKKLCFLLWYSVYAACRCEYCTAKERLWLYNLMVSQTKKRLTKILSTIQTKNSRK